eukprot:TRINITY_DN3643_c0_g1_i1.p1 TRINITY_DN3643_c0_g1~~TRINITY_DN3643_c0_g1_i1.p1  ORF type:complete len:327 (-),score=70.29 TRINITY_DN3643_c0_g1_i1:121-1038(-)
MRDRNSDDLVKIWYFPEYEGLEIPDFQLLQMQLRRIKEKDQFPDLVEVKYANISSSGRGVWKRDPTFGRGRAGTQPRRSPNSRPMHPRGGRPNPPPMGRGFRPRGAPQTSIRGRQRKRAPPAVPARDFPALPPRSSPTKAKQQPQTSPPMRSAPTPNIIPKPKRQQIERPKTRMKENRIIHESNEPKRAKKAIDGLAEKFADIDLVGIIKPTRWDGMVAELCRSSLRVLSKTSEGGELVLKLDSVSLQELASKILKNSPQIENVLHHTNIGAFGQDLSSRIDMIRCFSSENDYDAKWVRRITSAH